MGSPAKDGRSLGKKSNGQFKLYDHRESPSNVISNRVGTLGKRGTSGREGRKQWWWERWKIIGQRWRRQGRESFFGKSGTLSGMRGHALSQRLSSIHRPNHLPELLQTGTYRKPLPQQSCRRFDYMQVLRRSRAHKEGLSEKYKSLWTVQSTRAHRKNVPPSTGICTKRETFLEAATTTSPTGNE